MILFLSAPTGAIRIAEQKLFQQLWDHQFSGNVDLAKDFPRL